VHGRDNTSTWTRNEVTSAWTIQERSDDTISIHEQSECYTCKQYECNEYVRSALARSKYEYMDEEHSDECMDDTTIQYEERSDDTHNQKPSQAHL
jgi:hypothetical protein